MLPEVRLGLARLRAIRKEIDRIQKDKAIEELQWLESTGAVNPKARAALVRLEHEEGERVRAFEALLEEIQARGPQLKDLNQGLVDFYARRGETLVFLCWKEGEDAVRHWHPLETGFAGRRPLEDL